MFVNGENVNYLMLNGEVFSAQSSLPKLYKFNRDIDAGSKSYSISYDDKNNFKFIESKLTLTQYDLFFENYRKVPVYRMINYKNIEYALVSCVMKSTIGANISNPNFIISAQFWIRTSDAGGCTPL